MGLLDSWADRLTGPTPPPRRPLVAAGARINLRSPSIVHTKHPAWQSDAWAYRDDVDEMRAAGDFVSNTLGRLRIFAAENRPRGEEPVALEAATSKAQRADDYGVDEHTIECAVAAVDRLNINAHGSSLLARYAENLDYAGECYLLGQNGEDGEEWSIRSVSEVQVTQGGARLVEPESGAAMTEIDAAGSDLLRLWTPHPRYYQWPDAPVASLLNTLEGMRLIGRRGRAHDRSRISSGKAFYVPTNFSMVRPGQAPISAELPGATDDGAVDPFMEHLVDYMTAAIADESDPSAVVPLIIRGPAMIADRPAKEVLGTVDLHGEDPTNLDERYEALVMRFARGINLSPERVKGIGESTTNWTATAVTSDEIKVSVEPRAERMCDALTAAYLRPSLRAMGVPADQIRKVCLWFDSSELVEAPNRGEDAKAAHTAGAISDASLRTHLGFTEDDAPDNLEMLRRAVDRERLSPASVPILVKVLTGGMPTQDEAAQLVAPPVAPTPPGARPIIDATPRGNPDRPVEAPPVGQREQPATAAPAGQLTAAARGRGAKDDPQGPSVAGVVLLDSDTGRALMLQRGLDDPDDPAAGTWEFPGGHVEPGDESSLHAGMREWAEEVGRPFPEGGHVLYTWTSAEGVYQGHLVVLPGAEQLVDLDGARTVENADADYSEQAAWWSLEDARRNPALRVECRRSPWKAMRKAAETLTSPTVVAALSAALGGREQSGRFATPDQARRWRLDRAGSRRLVAIDRELTDRMLAHAEASVGRATEKAANRLRAAAAKADAARSPFPKGTDPRAVVAERGRALFVPVAPDEDLLAGAFDELERLWADEVDRAAAAVEETIDGMLEPSPVAASALTAASLRSIRAGIRDNAGPAWSWLKGALRDHAERVLYGEYTPSRGGEQSPGIVPAALVRGAVAIVGGLRRGAAGVDDDGRIVTGQGAQATPMTGPGTGEVALERLRVSGAAEVGHEWVYPPTPRRHFLPHRKLDGLQFTSWTDPALDAGSEASWVGPYLYPGDHDGCLCFVEPYVAIPMTEDADPAGPELAQLAADSIPPPTTAAGERPHPRGAGPGSHGPRSGGPAAALVAFAGLCGNPACLGADPGSLCTCPCGGAGHGANPAGMGMPSLPGGDGIDARDGDGTSSTAGDGDQGDDERAAEPIGLVPAEDDPVDPGGAPRDLTDDELEAALSANVLEGTDEAMERFEELSLEQEAREKREAKREKDRQRYAAQREEREAARAAADEAAWRVAEELIDQGWDPQEAEATARGVDIDEIAKRDALMDLERQGYRGGWERATRQAFELETQLEYERAENATKGAMLSKRGRANNVDPRKLLYGTDSFARANASEELRAYWDQTGGRQTLEAFRERLLLGDQATGRAFRGAREDYHQ